MQTVKKKTIMPNVDLTCITTDKFKTGYITINFITPLSKSSAAKNALLFRVLRRGTLNYPDMESISARLDSLYGAAVETVTRKKGEAQCVGLAADFIDDDFVPGGENILENTIALMGEMILSPATHGGLLTSEYVDSEKVNLIDSIKSLKNDKINYAVDLMVKSMCQDEAYSVSRLGTESTVAQITPQSLTKHYKELIASSKVEIIYVGSGSMSRVEMALLNALSALPRRNEVIPAVTDVVLTPKKPGNEVTDRMDVNQGKLTIGYRLGKSMLSPNYAALMVFNAVFGGAVTSKLFMNVREKLSLCYYASSIIEKHKGIMIVYSGVDSSNFSKALDEITRQLNAVKAGEITPWELDSAKKSVVTSLKSRLDSAPGLEDIYFDNAVAGIGISPEELAVLAEAVTAEEVSAIASQTELDTIHYLTGNGDDSNEA
jgi:predicted Zn-dependent peptidase